MTPLAAVVRAEWRRIRARPVARTQLVASLVGVAALTVLAGALRSAVTTGDGSPIFAAATGADAVGWLLTLRSAPIGLLLAALVGVGQSAGDLDAGVLRDDCCRPVRRADLVVARWLAGAAWCVVVQLLATTVALPGALLLFGAGGDWSEALGSLAALVAADAVALALGLAAGFLAGSPLGAVALLVVGGTLDTVAWLGTRALALGISVSVQLGGAPVADGLPDLLAALLPHAALFCWRGQPAAASAAVTAWVAICLAMAALRFARRAV